MNAVTLTFSFPTLAAAQDALARFDAALLAAPAAEIAHADRPDVGVAIAPPAPVAAAPAAEFNPFAGRGGERGPAAPIIPIVTAGVAAVPAAPTQAASGAVSPLSGAPAATAAVLPVGGVELDKSGLPWDGRIHGSTKTKNADGSWRQKRGLNDEALKNRIEAELRAGQAARALVAPAAAQAASVPAPPSTTAPSPAASPVLASSPTDAVAPPAPAAPVAGTETFGQLMNRLAPYLNGGDPARGTKVTEALGIFGLTSVIQLATAPEVLAPFIQTVDAMLATVPA